MSMSQGPHLRCSVRIRHGRLTGVPRILDGDLRQNLQKPAGIGAGRMAGLALLLLLVGAGAVHGRDGDPLLNETPFLLTHDAATGETTTTKDEDQEEESRRMKKERK